MSCKRKVFPTPLIPIKIIPALEYLELSKMSSIQTERLWRLIPSMMPLWSQISKDEKGKVAATPVVRALRRLFQIGRASCRERV